MTDPRLKALACNLVNYSTHVQAGQRVLIEATGEVSDLVIELVKAVSAAGAKPFVQLNDPRIQREIVRNAQDSLFDDWAKYDAYRMSDMDAYIGVRAGNNTFEMSDVPKQKLKQYSVQYSEPVHSKIRVPKTNWVVLRYPNSSMAQLAQTSTEAFEDFYFNVCNLDYKKMSAAMDPLVELMEKTDRVRIVGPGTDLEFSIKDIPVIKCDGHMNIPDGEIYTAPVRDSMNGYISYNTPSMHQGFCYSDIRFVVKDGKIIEATANDTEKVNHVLDTDANSRFFGEFAIGVNPYINAPMLDTLFDEKIAGSIHLTPGMAYDDAFNGNKSALHWDLVLIQTEQYGGGEIYFDGVLVRKNGLFVPESLQGLNPQQLISEEKYVL